MSARHPVLVVDDDADTREVLEELLRAEGFYIATATNGFEAIQVALTSPKPCVIILDERMPLMSGLEFLRHREKDPRLADIPVIFTTGDPIVFREFSARGAVALRKPFDVDALIGVVREHCA
jgi:two-component system, OmpR family, response regulator CpxR